MLKTTSHTRLTQVTDFMQRRLMRTQGLDNAPLVDCVIHNACPANAFLEQAGDVAYYA